MKSENWQDDLLCFLVGLGVVAVLFAAFAMEPIDPPDGTAYLCEQRCTTALEGVSRRCGDRVSDPERCHEGEWVFP